MGNRDFNQTWPVRMAWNASVATKVLVPSVSIMVLLLILTSWLVNRRITGQFKAEAARTLETADSIFRSSESLRARNLVLRFGNLPSEPRFKGALQSKHLQTIRDALHDLPAEAGVDVALFSSTKADLQASAARDPSVPIATFQSASAAAFNQSLKGEPKVDTIRVGDRLFDIVSIPVFGSSSIPIFGGTSDTPIGVLTIGSEIGDSVARELSAVTHSQIVLLANGHVVASTVAGKQWREQLSRVFEESRHDVHGQAGPRRLLLGEEHYYCCAGKFESLNADTGLGYLLLASYEQPLRAFHGTQLMLLFVSALGIVLGTVVIGLLVRKVTEPLRQLQAGAEAVGRGDFTRSVTVTSNDECGKLAGTFNRMTENLKQSREELERTVSTLKVTQRHLIQSEKLSGIGEFVAGVAHELNNPLTAVMGFSELLVQSPDNPKRDRYLGLVLQGSKRCQKIVQSLLMFARLHPPERRRGNINDLVQTTIEFVQYQFRTSNIEIVTRLAPEIPDSMVDAHQMQQVFLNLLNNARQAIEAKGGPGRVLISTELMDGRIRIAFEDDGRGIAEENLQKVFDPFFTTKDIGQGTGLGLSLCYGVVTEHGGTIQVRSEEGRGAIFVIDLPIVTPPPAQSVEVVGSATPLLPLRAGTGKKVLVIDDEAPILEMVQSELAQQGFEVDVAQDGETALRCFSQNQYDLALCDWKMPGLNGGEIYERLRRSNSAICDRFVFITGDVINGSIQKFLRDQRKACLSKPFSLAEFRATVEKALGED